MLMKISQLKIDMWRKSIFYVSFWRKMNSMFGDKYID